MCSAKLRKGVRFCWKCNADQTSAGPPDENTSSGQQQESFGRPRMGQKRKAMSIESYMKAKSTERQSGSTFRSKKKNPAKIEKKVSVNIDIKVISPKGLKIVRGKRLPVTVLQQSTVPMPYKQYKSGVPTTKTLINLKSMSYSMMMTDVLSLCLVNVILIYLLFSLRTF